ncbi:MAG: hypothetical protein LBL51_00125, partial [Synergistaceae bacterium]|nr:hypothetical protein [Synergistaceae bacterium]
FSKNLAALFKAPLNVEVDFSSSKPGSALMSMAVNLLEALADAKRLESIEPLKAGGFFSAGGGKLFLGAAGPYLFRPEDFKSYPGFDEAWEKVLAGLKTVGLDGTDLENLLAGVVTVALGGEATFFMGPAIPGGYVALTGQKDAASKLLRAIVESEPASAASLFPVKAEGWSSLFQVNPAVVPVPLLVGVKGGTLFAGVLDLKSLNQTPELPPEGRELFGKDSFGAGFIDMAGIWEYLRNAAGDAASPLNAALARTPEGQNLARLLLDADFPLKFVKMWTPTLETGFLEITATDVPQEKRLLPKLANLVSASRQRSAERAEAANIVSDLRKMKAASFMFHADKLSEIEKGTVTIHMAKLKPYLDKPDKYDSGTYIFEELDGKWWVGIDLRGKSPGIREMLKGRAAAGLLGEKNLGVPYTAQDIVWMCVR